MRHALIVTSFTLAAALLFAAAWLRPHGTAGAALMSASAAPPAPALAPVGAPAAERRDEPSRDALRERDARRERGLAYMEARQRLIETFEGDALEVELDRLRERTFGHEAPIIAREEQAGFFRYARPRVQGRD
jgi:hypothetical protein